MQTNKKSKIAIGICIAICFLLSVLLIFMNIDAQKTTDNTTECNATVHYIAISDTNERYAEIYTNEYQFSLYISTNIFKQLDVSELSLLSEGTRIYFRVDNVNKDSMYDSQFCPIVSLKTDNQDIISLDTYNQLLKKSMIPTNIVVILILIVLLFCIIFLYKKKLYKKKA